MQRALDRISRVSSQLVHTATMTSASTVTSPAWRTAVLTALKKNGKHMPYVKYFQMATVKPDGRPANRTVVYRGFLGDTPDITMVTDLRSGKVQEIRANPAGEFAWYMPETRDQFRIAGDLTVVAHDSATMQKERQEAWAKMSPGGRAQFAWPVPGFPRLDDENPDAFDIPAPFARAMIMDSEDAATSIDESLEEDTDAEAIPAPAQNTIREVLSKDFLLAVSYCTYQ